MLIIHIKTALTRFLIFFECRGGSYFTPLLFLAEVLMHLAQTFTLMPSTSLVCTLIFCLRLVITKEWLRDWLERVPRPQT